MSIKTVKTAGLSLLVASCAFLAPAADFYVDAVNGNDDWDGSSSNYVSGVTGPKRTLEGMASVVPANAGHTIWALPGWYDSKTNAAYAARVNLPKKTRLISTGGRDVTFIVGSCTNGAPESCLKGPDVTRCVSMFDGAVLQGFTLVGGRATTYTGNENTTENHNGGVRFNTSSSVNVPAIVADCVITNCAAMRGGASYGENKVRCFFVNCRVTGCSGTAPMSVIARASLWNCVIDGSKTPNTANNTIANCDLWNCTMANPADYNSMSSCEAWNCLFPAMTDNGDSTFHHCLTSLAKNSKTTWDETTQVAEGKLRLNANYRPDSLENAGLNAGDDASYEASFVKFNESVAFVSDITPLLQKDWLGGPRIACGQIDIGAGEFSIADVKGLTMTVTDLGDGTSQLSVSQDPAGERYASTFSFDGETVSLDANAPGWTWTKVISGGLGDHTLLPVYADVNYYYVDNLNGDDGDTGVGRFHAVKTIQTAMDRVAKGGTVRVMPGTYSHAESKTADGNGKSNVVVFKQQNVTLESVKGPKWTVIEGNPVQGDEGVRCVYANQSGSVVRGFALRNGGTPKIDGAGNGAGILNGTAVDCVITGCKAGGRGGAAYGSTLVRCYMEDCTVGAGTGSAMEQGKMYGCVVKGLTYYGSSCEAVNCTFIDGHPSYGALRGNGTSAVNAYNVLLVGGNNQASAGLCNFHNSIITGGIAANDTVDDDCKVGVGTADYPYDPVTFRPLAGAGQVNVGSNSYYEAKYPAAYKDEHLDFAGGARIVDEVIDIGAGEYSAEAARLLACSQALATDGRVTVTAADAGVAATDAGKVAIPADASLTLDWDIPYGGTGAAAYRYRVELAPGATLKVYEGGELVEEIATSGDHQFRSAVNHHFTFVAAGGTAVLSSFSNMGYLTVVDAKGRMVITGASLGTTEVFPGASVTATFARDGYVKPLLEGILVNGEFRSFTGAEADVVRTVEVTDASGLVTVEAVYAVTNHWYVDADKGIDTNDGFTPYRARKTLVKAMELATTAGDVVHAAPGTYAEGGVATLTTTTNRVEVAKNCGLVADQGPAVTVIEGKWSTDETANKGCGPDAIRCAALGSGAWIRGFTLRYGATAITGDYSETGGGVYGKYSNCSALDCIIENCRAKRGGACSGGCYVRCLTRGNDSVDECGATLGGLSGYDAVGYYGCVFTDGLVYGNITKVVNCSFIGTALKGNTTRPHVYNSYVCLDDTRGNYHNCVYGSRTLFSGDNVQYNSVLDDDCVQASGDAVAVDAAYRPLATATALLDKGRNDYYDDNWTEKWPGATDVADGQRIYNAAVDIGAGEYDWRPVYASRLVGRRGEVVAASAGVMEGETGVLLADGESLTVDWTAKREGAQTFTATVTGEGTLTVLADGVPLAPADGAYSFEAEAGSVTRLEISFAGTGSAEVLKFKGPPVGMLLLVR